MKSALPASVVLALSFLFSPAHALDVQISSNLLMFGSASKVTISGPGNYVFDSDLGRISVKGGGGSSATTVPNLSFVSPQELGIVADGVYTFEAMEIVLGGSSLVDDPVNGRSQVPRSSVQSVSVESGSFTVLNGSIVDSSLSE